MTHIVDFICLDSLFSDKSQVACGHAIFLNDELIVHNAAQRTQKTVDMIVLNKYTQMLQNFRV